MGDYASEKYLEAKKWVSKKITDGYSWDDVKTLCVSIDEAKNEFIQLRDDELILPEDMEFREWPEFIDEMKKGYSAISDPYGLSNGSAGTTLPIPTDPGSPWTQYKKYLLGQKDGKRRISDNAVTQIEKNSHWILNHILRDTRVTGPKKGLVMGSVQSGKTANMIGLATMAAHYDWNYIIILSGNKVAEDGTYLRIVYPDDHALKLMEKAPVFIIMGGNTLARGLTIEGLVCTYFGRNSNQADSLMQMARWFGYRKGYELLQRIWMPKTVQEKFELLEKIDEKLKAVFEDYMLKGRSPRQFGPKITTTATIARFLLTSKNKSQNAVECDFDFSGDSYETTRFEDDDYLSHNIAITEFFLQSLGDAVQSEAVSSAFVWYDIDFSILEKEFFGAEKYHIYECSSVNNGKTSGINTKEFKHA